MTAQINSSHILTRVMRVLMIAGCMPLILGEGCIGSDHKATYISAAGTQPMSPVTVSGKNLTVPFRSSDFQIPGGGNSIYNRYHPIVNVPPDILPITSGSASDNQDMSYDGSDSNLMYHFKLGAYWVLEGMQGNIDRGEVEQHYTEMAKYAHKMTKELQSVYVPSLQKCIDDLSTGLRAYRGNQILEAAGVNTAVLPWGMGQRTMESSLKSWSSTLPTMAINSPVDTSTSSASGDLSSTGRTMTPLQLALHYETKYHSPPSEVERRSWESFRLDLSTFKIEVDLMKSERTANRSSLNGLH